MPTTRIRPPCPSPPDANASNEAYRRAVAPSGLAPERRPLSKRHPSATFAPEQVMHPVEPIATPSPTAPRADGVATRDHRGGPWLGRLYLVLAVAGAILPWLANLEFMQAYGASFDLGLFIGLANANPAAASLSRDLAVGATAITVWMVSESRRLQMRGLPWVLLSCVTLAFACGAPLFLYLRERRLAELARES